jgi:CRISPR-associated endonuclease/helicase Cas3
MFSALVDADFLDTEDHFEVEEVSERGRAPALGELWPRFEADQRRLTGKLTDTVNRIRHEVYQACVQAATGLPGFYRLTVPTGGGKTRSALAFGLLHARRHGMKRVIVALPYTTIIEQTAQSYRSIFGPEVVLEHHSAVAVEEDDEYPSPAQTWARLAAENWMLLSLSRQLSSCSKASSTIGRAAAVSSTVLRGAY